MNHPVRIVFNVSGLDDVQDAIARAKDSINRLEKEVSDIWDAASRLGLEANQLMEDPPAD